MDFDLATRRLWNVRVPRKSTEDKWALLRAACHRDGHVREAVLALIDETGDNTFAPVLAIRAADWVPQVRDRARAICRAWLSQDPQRVLAFGPVALLIEPRAQGRWLADELRNLVRASDDVLSAGLTASNALVRRTAYHLGLEAGRIAPAAIVDAALTDPDLKIRLACADVAFRGGVRDVLHRLRTSGTAAIRAEALHRLAEAGEPEPALAALLDTKPLVRAIAQRTARHNGIDPAAHYRKLLDQGEAHARTGEARSAVAGPVGQKAALAGLGETGTAEDQDLLWPYLDNPDMWVRAEAIRVLRRLGAQPNPTLVRLLTDPAPLVVRRVAALLRPYAHTLDEDFLRTLLDPENPLPTRYAAYQLIRARDTWARVEVDFRLVADADEWLRNQARSDLRSWLLDSASTVYTKPAADRRARLLDLMADAEPVLGPDRVHQYRFHLVSGR